MIDNIRTTTEVLTRFYKLYVAAGVSFFGVAAVFLGVDFAFGAFFVAVVFFAGLVDLAGPLVTRPDLVLPRTFFSSTMAGAWVVDVSMVLYGR